MEKLDSKLQVDVDSGTIQNYENGKEEDEEATSNYNNAGLMAADEPSIEIEGNADAVDYYPPAVYVNDNDDIECLPGYRFNPFDHELIVHYLLKKVNKQRLPHNKIKEVELYKYNPEEITKTDQGLVEKEWYFFTPRDRKYKNGTRPNRAAGDGYWKATGADKKVLFKGEIVGYRKALVFYQGKAPKGDKTNWIMHEFRVHSSTQRVRTHDGDMRLDDWVLCRIYKKDDKVKKAPRQNHTVENSQSEEQSPIRVPSSPATTAAQFPTPVTSNIGRDGMESHLASRIAANPFSFSDASVPNNFFCSHSLAVDTPQPLNYYAYDLPLFPNQLENYTQDEFHDISMESLDDFSSLPSFRQNYEYVSTNNFQNDSVVWQNAGKNNPGLPNNSLVVTSQSVSSSPAGHSST